MISPDDSQFNDLARDARAAERHGAEIAAKRKELLDMQCTVQALSFQLAAAEKELQSLEGRTLTRLFSSLRGDQAGRAAELRQAAEHLRQQHDAAGRRLEALQHQVDAMESRVQSARQAQAAYGAAMQERLHAAEAGDDELAVSLRAMTSRAAGCTAVIQSIERALKAGDEARRDLLSEIETLSTFGRSRTARGAPALAALIRGAMRGEVEQCAGRIRQAVRRFCTRWDEALRPPGVVADDADRAARNELQRIAERFGGEWFYNEADSADSSSSVENTLRSANMLLERHRNRVRLDREGIEKQRLESLGPPALNASQDE